MIPYSAVQGHRTVQNQLSTAATVELGKLLRSTEELSPEKQASVLHEAFPVLFDPYVAAGSAVAASFYEEIRDMSEVKGRVQAETLDRVDPKRWGALVGWGAGASMFEAGGQALVLSLLSGGLSRALSEVASDTIIGNASKERVKVGYQRVPSPGCCGFCGMLASRGVAYGSEDEAMLVQGRGIPVGQGRGHGSKGRGRGLRVRGSRRIGETFHDHCKCTGVPVFEDNWVEMQADADKYYEAYREAYDNADKGLVRVETTYKIGPGDYKTKYSWATNEGKPITPKERIKMIAAAMSQELGVS